MKQITIYEFLKKNEGVIKKGWVCYNGFEDWLYFRWKPKKESPYWMSGIHHCECPVFLSRVFNIAPFDGSWKDSLIKVEHKEEV